MTRRFAAGAARRIAAGLFCAAALACGGDDTTSENTSGNTTGSASGIAPDVEAETTTQASDAPDVRVQPATAPIPDIVHLSREQLAISGIELAPAGPGPVDSGSELVGEVHPNGDRVAHITPRFPGIVRDVLANAGDAVRPGDVLAVIESSDSLAPYSVKTAIGGVVIAKDLTRGEAVERTKQAFVVADLASVWVDLAVYQKDLGRIRVGQRVHIDAVGEGPAAEGAISYITPSVDQVTRTATARVVLANPERKFLPGMFVTAHALEVVDAAVAVPRDAIQTLADQTCVFVDAPEGLVRRPVTLGREGTELVEIVSGLKAGERIVVKNSFLVKAELAKHEADGEG